MVETPGFCSRKDRCSVAKAGHAVRVPLEHPFVCPECGFPLTPPALYDAPPLARRPGFLAAAIAAVALLVGTAVLAQAGLFHRHSPAGVPVPEPALMSLDAAAIQGQAPVIEQESLVLPPPAALSATELTAPRHTPREAVLRAPAEQPATRRKPSGARHHAAVHPVFSVPLIAGGEPDYPDEYQDGESGNVTISCRLRPDGTTQNCATLRQSGGGMFAVAVHRWLALRDVRFKITRIRGRLTDHVTLTVEFIGEAPPT